MFKCLNSHVYGEYSFDGKCLPSAEVYARLPEKNIKQIITEVRKITSEHDVDYVLIFENEMQERVLAIDNISNPEKKSLKRAGYSHDIDGFNYYSLVFDHANISD
jgi:hypothetical protein